MIPKVRILFVLGLSALTLAACSSVSRQTTTSTAADQPWWDEEGELGPDAADSDDMVPDDIISDDGVAAEPDSADADSLSEDAAPDLSPEAIAALRAAYAGRTEAQRKRVLRVNEYVRWCLDHGMWEEARIHLEQALQADSLAASLHNNLGIVYERMGRRTDARSRYQLAASLNPDRPLYEDNLKRLRNALKAPRRPRPVRLDTGVVDDLLLPGAVDEYNPAAGAMLIRSEDEVQSVFP